MCFHEGVRLGRSGKRARFGGHCWNFHGPGCDHADLGRALEFYDRWLPGTIRRITGITRTCTPQCVTLLGPGDRIALPDTANTGAAQDAVGEDSRLRDTLRIPLVLSASVDDIEGCSGRAAAP